ARNAKVNWTRFFRRPVSSLRGAAGTFPITARPGAVRKIRIRRIKRAALKRRRRRKRKPLPECRYVAHAPLAPAALVLIETAGAAAINTSRAISPLTRITSERFMRSPDPSRFRPILFALIISAQLMAVMAALALAQSGRNVASGRRTTIIPLIAQRANDPSRPKPLLASSAEQDADKIITKNQVEVFDGGVLQKIESLAPDPSPARFVVLMDNSATLQCDIKKLASVPAAFAPEIYEGDKVMVIGYDTKPEVITDFTDDPKELQNTLGLLRKTDSPRLFDALNVAMEDVLRPTVGFTKRVI